MAKQVNERLEEIRELFEKELAHRISLGDFDFNASAIRLMLRTQIAVLDYIMADEDARPDKAYDE